MSIKDLAHNIRAIRDLLKAAFTPEELRRFCEDRPWLRPVVDDFGTGYGLNEMVDRVITYSQKQDLFPELLAAVQEVNPRQFERYAEEISRPEEVPSPRGRGKREPQGVLSRTIHQAPRPLADFVGRRNEIRQLVRTLQPGAKAAITGIVGMGGLGKTELANVVAHEVAGQFPDGVLWANCGQQELTAIADLWAAAYGAQLVGDDLPAKASAWRGLISSKQALLIFDNVQAGQDVQDLFPPLGQSAVLVTSRDVDHPALHGATSLKLNQFTRTEARALARKVLGKQAAGQQIMEAYYLFELVEYLPLAVAVALQSARECGWKLAYLNEKLVAAGALEVLGDEKLLGQSLRATFETAWESLAEELRDTFRTLALFNEGPSFSTFAVAETLDLPEPEAGARLGQLARRSLLTVMECGRWELHPLLRQFATTRPPVVDVIWTRMARHYAHVAAAANALYQQGGERMTQGLALFDLEWPHIRVGQTWAAAHAEVNEDASRLCSDYAGYCIYCLDLRLHPTERIRWLEAGIRAARLAEAKEAVAAHLCNLGNSYAALGEVQRAIGYHKQSLAIHREIRDRRGEGVALGNLGNAYKNLGEARTAIGYYDQALAIAREIRDRRGEANALGNLGVACRNLGEAQRAIGYLDQCLSIHREIGDRRGEGNTLGNLGNAYLQVGEVQWAISFYKQALEIDREIGNRRSEGTDLGSLGNVYLQVGEAQQAIGYYKQAVEIAREIGDRRGEGNALSNLGVAYAAVGEAQRAIGCHEQSLTIHREIDDRRGQANAVANLGAAYYHVGKTSQARELWTQALSMFEIIEDPYAERVRGWLAKLSKEASS